MIPRNRPRPEQAEPTPSGPTEQIEVTDYDFSFGYADSISFTIGPKDSFEKTEDVFELRFVDGEFIQIPRDRVRWWSSRTRKVSV